MVTTFAHMVTQDTAHQVATTINKLMEERDLTQLQVANATGIPRTILRRRLTGYSPFTLTELDAISGYLETPVDQLIQGAVA